MKAQDLMIGDWVYRVDFKEPIPVRILGLEVINYVTNPKQYVADVFCPKYNNNVGLYMDEICPIPLTEEILVKNGFVQSGSKFTCGEISVIFTIKGFSFWTKHMISIAVDNGSRINNLHRYVHELQHALRLCGINKEIEL